jgi:hypothetical protein
MLYDDNGQLMMGMESTFTQWRSAWNNAYKAWSAPESRRGRPVERPRYVNVTQPIRTDESAAAEGYAHYFADPDAAEDLGRQDAQYSSSKSLDCAPLDFIRITDPRYLYPTRTERARLHLRAPWTPRYPFPMGGVYGGSTGFVASAAGLMVAAGQVGPLGLSAVLGTTALGAALGAIPKWKDGASVRTLGAGHLVESAALCLAMNCWLTTLELRRIVDDGELDLTASQMREILWDAADYLNRHDRDVEIDYTLWDPLIPTLDQVLTALTARLEHERSPDSPPTDAQTQTIEHQQNMLEQNLNQLTVELQAIAATQDRPGR